MKSLSNEPDREEILKRLHNLREASPRKWGRMSAHQAVCHLSDSFRAVMGEKEISGTPSFLNRTLVKWIALHVPAQWPHGVKTMPEVDQMLGGTHPVEFARDVRDLEDLTKRFVRTDRFRAHPIFGTLSLAEWQRWAYLHMDHHLRQFGV